MHLSPIRAVGARNSLPARRASRLRRSPSACAATRAVAAGYRRDIGDTCIFAIKSAINHALPEWTVGGRRPRRETEAETRGPGLSDLSVVLVVQDKPTVRSPVAAPARSSIPFQTNMHLFTDKSRRSARNSIPARRASRLRRSPSAWRELAPSRASDDRPWITAMIRPAKRLGVGFRLELAGRDRVLDLVAQARLERAPDLHEVSLHVGRGRRTACGRGRHETTGRSVLSGEGRRGGGQEPRGRLPRRGRVADNLVARDRDPKDSGRPPRERGASCRRKRRRRLGGVTPIASVSSASEVPS